MVLRLYVDHTSQPARAVMLFVRANKLPVEEVKINLWSVEQMTPEFARINRFHKVPALVHDDFHLSESVAILKYLARAFPVPDHWYPRDLRARARVDEYMAWQHIGLRVPVTYHYLSIVKPHRLGPTPPTPAEVQNYKSKMAAALDDIENKWLGRSEFIAGNEISIADLLAAAEVEMTRMTVNNASAGRPKIAEYLRKVREAVGSQVYDEVHDEVFKYEENAKATMARSHL